MAVASPQQQLSPGALFLMISYLAGLIAADGYVSEREVRISTSSREYAEYVADIVRRCLGKAPKIEIGKGVLLLRIYDVSFGKILETKYGIPIGRKSSTIPLPLWLELPDIID